MTVQVNYLAVLLAAIVSMGIGFLWYSPMVLGKQWMKEKGLTAEKLKSAQKEMGVLYGVSFVLALVMAYILSHVMVFSLNFYHMSELSTGLMSAFWMWLGFVMPTQASATIFGGKNWKLLGIDTGFQLVSLLAMGTVLALL
ncbi:MAG: hypothetical protein CEO12_671 [Parcubacteria group bacterium Gr01-1014_46]|nr:MAG: hypothetical protein CEO12_671 [Parcubacteria group bacterium Gr01-1014_46]